MGKFVDKVIPFMGVKFDASPLLHFVRDLIVALLLWFIGFRDFQAAFTTMLTSAFFETGNGVAFQRGGSHDFFDFLDFLPSVVAGFLVVSVFSGSFDIKLLITLFLIYAAIVVILVVINLILGRKITIEK